MRPHNRPIISSTALIAGTTVGAGILALPTATLPAGVIPSTLGLLVVWFYMVVSGLLIAEVNLNLTQRTGIQGLGLLAMAKSTLGNLGAWTAGTAYLLLHYALLVAYMTRGGDILASTLAAISQRVDWFPLLPSGVGALLFAGIYGGFLYWGRPHWIARFNTTLVAIALIAFFGLLSLAMTHVQPQQLWLQHWPAVSAAIPVMLVAFVYHNVVPVVVTQLDGNVSAIRGAIMIGSAVPLGMFLAWNTVILGIVSPADISGMDPLEVLRQGEAGSLLGIIVAIFSEVAIATSFMGFVYGLLNFFTDAWQVSLPEDSIQPQRLGLFSLVLLPPLGLCSVNPHLFIRALEYAGAFGIAVLFGIIPALMAWRQRYHSPITQAKTVGSSYSLVPGGQVMLVTVLGFAGMAIAQQVWQLLFS